MHTEVSAIENAEAILLETEVAIFSVFIMHHRSDVHNDILSAEILQHRELFGALFNFLLLSCEVDDWIDNLYQLVIQVRHDKRANTTDGEVEVVDQIALLIEVRRCWNKLLLHATADPGQEILVTSAD